MRAYAAGGASALSVLTDEPFFAGRLDDLRAGACARRAAGAAQGLHRRRYQMVEARAAGADAILLIVAALDDTTLAELLAHGRALRAGRAGGGARRRTRSRGRSRPAREIIGINNRDLRTFTVDRELAVRLRPSIPADRIVVAESGIRNAADVARLRDAGVDAILVGETLMRAPDPAAALRGLLAG